MKYLLSYASNPTVSSEKSNLRAEGLIESAIRNLLSELTRLGFGIPAPESCASVQHQFLDRYGQTSRPLGQNTEMKRGDWICPRYFLIFLLNNHFLSAVFTFQQASISATGTFNSSLMTNFLCLLLNCVCHNS